MINAKDMRTISNRWFVNSFHEYVFDEILSEAQAKGTKIYLEIDWETDNKKTVDMVKDMLVEEGYEVEFYGVDNYGCEMLIKW